MAGDLTDPTARTLVSGDLAAVFLPSHGMLGASLRHRGVELLRRLEDLRAAAAKGSTAGIALLHPWANRLADARYSAAGRDVTLDPNSPLLHLDEKGLPIHGVPWSRLVWEVTEVGPDRLMASLEWTRPELLAIFPFRHRLELTATLRPDGLTLETTLIAGAEGQVPVSFGFHPYLGLPDLPRAEWRVRLPPMRRLTLDPLGIPTGQEESFGGHDGRLGDLDLDAAFALPGERQSFSLTGPDRRIVVDFLAGYCYTQLFAPKDKEFIALEPMTAPTSALTSGRGLRLVSPGTRFFAAFRIGVDAIT